MLIGSEQRGHPQLSIAPCRPGGWGGITIISHTENQHISSPSILYGMTNSSNQLFSLIVTHPDKTLDP